MSLLALGSRRRKLEQEIRDELMPKLIQEAKHKALLELEQEKLTKSQLPFTVTTDCTTYTEPNKIARLITSKVTDYKHQKCILDRIDIRNEAQIAIQEKVIQVIVNSLTTYLEKHVSLSYNNFIELTENNKDFIHDFDSLKLSDDKLGSVMYKDFITTNSGEYSIINSLKYYYRPYISMRKDCNKVKILWGVDYCPKIIKEDKYLSKIFGISNIEIELLEKDLEMLEGALTYSSSTTAKLVTLSLIMTTTFKGDKVNTSTLHVPGGMDKIINEE